MMREYEARREIENIYDKSKKNIKAMIEAKGASCKGSAKGTALAEIMSVFDDEMGIGIAEELFNARRAVRQYYKKYSEIEALEQEYKEKEEKLKEQKALADTISLLTDDVLKNAIIAYKSIDNGRYSRNANDAKDICIAYIKTKGREDLMDTIKAVEEDG